MSKLLQGIQATRIAPKPDVSDWSAAVRREFGPFIRRKSILSKYPEILRTELVNLRKIAGCPECMRQLRRLVRLYRRELTGHHASAIQQLIALFPGTIAADGNWMSLFMRGEESPFDSVHDEVYEQFDRLDSILEGCHKHHFRVLYSFAVHRTSSTFPADVAARDYGALVATLPQWARAGFRYLCEDPEHSIAVNQWRNVAAHKSFTIRSCRTLDVTYGRPPNQRTKRITTASLRRALDWSMKALNTLRLASVIVYLEYMGDLHATGLPECRLRLDSWLVHIFQNLRLVGFHGVAHDLNRNVFTVDLFDAKGRPVRDAAIHASQILDQMSVAVDSDPSVGRRPTRVRVRLVNGEGAVVATASVKTANALAHSEGKLTLQQYVDSVDFTSTDIVRTERGAEPDA
jgi:hypothetical protein